MLDPVTLATHPTAAFFRPIWFYFYFFRLPLIRAQGEAAISAVPIVLHFASFYLFKYKELTLTVCAEDNQPKR
jgi:hypothetical protein